jgi:hypothetical protein
MLDRFDIWLGWLKELGGSYSYLRDEKSTKVHEPKGKPTQRPLDPEKYTTDTNGTVRRKVNE